MTSVKPQIATDATVVGIHPDVVDREIDHKAEENIVMPFMKPTRRFHKLAITSTIYSKKETIASI